MDVGVGRWAECELEVPGRRPVKVVLVDEGDHVRVTFPANAELSIEHAEGALVLRVR